MANINEEARIPVYINDEQAKSALKALQGEAEKWRKKMYEAMSSGDMKGMKSAETELKKANRQMAQLKKEAFDVNKVLDNLSTASMKDLRRTAQKLNKEMEGLTRGTKEYAALEGKLQRVRAEMGRINKSIREQRGRLSKIADFVNRYWSILSGGIAVLTGVVFSVKEMIKGLVGLDDSLSDVMKTTGLTRKQVREMYSDFKYLNTRTPRKELLLLAEEAGRLGIKGKKGVEDFVEVANKIKVALGDDLGGNAQEAIREVGKLVEVYKIGDQYGTDFKESLNKVGSAINEVSANSNSQAQYQIGFLKRMGGTATQAKISAADILGYASTLDQLGQAQEMAATAQGKVLINMFKDHATYAKIAHMESGKFFELLNTDANEAFIKVLEGLNGNNEGLTVLAQKLDGLGLDGARATQVLAALASNTEMVRKQQALANKAMQEGTSLTNEYNIKNNNLAGSMAKIGQYLRTKFVNSTFLGWMEKVVAKTARLTEFSMVKKLQDERQEMNKLVMKIASLNEGDEKRLELLNELKEKYPDYYGEIDAATISNNELLKSLREVNKQMVRQIYIASRKEELSKLQENAADKLAVEMGYQEKLNNLKNSYFQKMGTEQQKIFTADFDFMMHQYEKITSMYSSNTQKAMAVTKWLQKNKLSKQYEGGLDYGDMTALYISYSDWREAYKRKYKAEADAQKEAGKIDAYEDMWGLNSSSSASGTGTTPTPPATMNLSAEEQKKASKEAIKILDEAHQERLDKLTIQYEKEAWTEKRYQAEQLTAELAYLYQKKAILEKFGQDTLKTDAQISTKRAEQQDKLNEVLAEGDKELFDEIAADSKEVDKAAEETMKIADNAIKSLENSEEKEKQIMDRRRDAYLQFAQMVGQSFGELLADSESTLGDYLKNTLVMALEALHQYLFLAKAKAWIKAATEGAPINVAAVAKAMAKIVFMEAAYQAVKTSLTTGFSSGGPTGPGDKYEVAGVVHKKEYVIPSEGTENPGLKPVIDIIEIARRNGSLARLDLRPVVQMVQGKQMYTGGYSSPSGSGTSSESSSGYSFSSQSDPELKALLKTATAVFKDLKENPPTAYINMYGHNSFSDAYEKMNSFYSKVKRTKS